MNTKAWIVAVAGVLVWTLAGRGQAEDTAATVPLARLWEGNGSDDDYYRGLHQRYKAQILAAVKAGDSNSIARLTDAFNDSIEGCLLYSQVTRLQGKDWVSLLDKDYSNGAVSPPKPVSSVAPHGSPVHMHRWKDFTVLESSRREQGGYEDDVIVTIAIAKASVVATRFVPAWGEPVNGVQIRVVRGLRSWTVGETPSFITEASKAGKTIDMEWGDWQPCEIEFDDQPYAMAVDDPHITNFALDKHWLHKKTREPLRLTAGRHALRLKVVSKAAGGWVASRTLAFYITDRIDPAAFSQPASQPTTGLANDIRWSSDANGLVCGLSSPALNTAMLTIKNLTLEYRKFTDLMRVKDRVTLTSRIRMALVDEHGRQIKRMNSSSMLSTENKHYLQQGQAYQYIFDVRQAFDILEPGRYTLAMEVRLSDAMDWTRCPDVVLQAGPEGPVIQTGGRLFQLSPPLPGPPLASAELEAKRMKVIEDNIKWFTVSVIYTGPRAAGVVRWCVSLRVHNPLRRELRDGSRDHVEVTITPEKAAALLKYVRDKGCIRNAEDIGNKNVDYRPGPRYVAVIDTCGAAEDGFIRLVADLGWGEAAQKWIQGVNKALDNDPNAAQALDKVIGSMRPEGGEPIPSVRTEPAATMPATGREPTAK